MNISVTLLRVVAVAHKAAVAVSTGTKAAVGGVATYAEAVQSYTHAVKLNKADRMRENAVRAQAKAFEMADDLEVQATTAVNKAVEEIANIRSKIGI